MSRRQPKAWINQHRRRRESLLGTLLLLPALVAITVAGITPILITISYSFQHRQLTDPLHIYFVGFDNYLEIFHNGRFQEPLRNTLRFALYSIVVQFTVGMTGALLMNSAKRMVGLIRTVILIPWAIPGIITAHMFSYMFNDQFGVINAILLRLHLIEKLQALLTSRAGAMFIIVLADTWKQFPFMALLLLSGLQTIPDELYESASVDGAGSVNSFFRITLPNLRQIILIVLLFRSMGALRVFDIVYGITGGGPGNATSTLLYQAYRYLFGDMNFGMGAAMSTIITMMILILSAVYMLILGRREE